MPVEAVSTGIGEDSRGVESDLPGRDDPLTGIERASTGNEAASTGGERRPLPTEKDSPGGETISTDTERARTPVVALALDDGSATTGVDYVMNAMRFASLLALPLAACAHATPPQNPPKAPGRYVETMKVGGLARRFILRVPRSYTGGRTPVVMVLHGWMASAEAAEAYTRMAEKSEKEGFVAVFPDGVGNPKGWNAGFIDLTGMDHPDDLGFLTAVLDRVEGEIAVDRNREYVVGHSNGAFMANFLGAKIGGRLAAIASMAGTVGLGPGVEIPKPVAPLSVLLLHGRADATVGYAPNSNALLHNEGAVASARFWAKADDCLAPQTTRTGGVTIDRYEGGKGGTEVELVSVDGAPHDWWGGLGFGGPVPTYGAPVADLVWEFFKAHPKKR